MGSIANRGIVKLPFRDVGGKAAIEMVVLGMVVNVVGFFWLWRCPKSLGSQEAGWFILKSPI